MGYFLFSSQYLIPVNFHLDWPLASGVILVRKKWRMMKPSRKNGSSEKEPFAPRIPHEEPEEPMADTNLLQVTSKRSHTWEQIRKLFGPGLITGASDDDPSGIGTYTTAGASFGYSTLWTALLTFPLMTIVQYLCAKVGMV